MENLIEKNLEKLKKILKKEGVVLAYLFGSAARGKIGPLSDIDIAVLFSEKIKKGDYFDKRLKLAGEIDRVLKTKYETEVVCLNEAPPVLKHEVVFDGIMIFAKNKKNKFEFENQVMKKYEDTKYLRDIVFKAMGERIKEGVFGKTPFPPKKEKIFLK